jgi:hypothetical protein
MVAGTAVAYFRRLRPRRRIAAGAERADTHGVERGIGAMLVKIVVFAALVGVGLFVAKEEQLFEKAGLVGRCQLVRAPAGDEGEWRACSEGLMSGFPSLVKDSCTRESRSSGYEYWRCPVPLSRSRTSG